MARLQPKPAQALCAFLGLVGYYRKFIKAYGAITAPLTQLLKKEGFSWSPTVQQTFETLRTALATKPILQLPGFSTRFIAECDASGTGLSDVLHQGSGSIAFFSRPIAACHHVLAAYELELIGLVQAVRHLRPYLCGRSFLVHIDHYNLKFLLDQHLPTIPQHH